MYELWFSDGQRVRTDAGHLWAVSSRSTRRRDGSIAHIEKMADVDRRASVEAERLRFIAAAISPGTMETGNDMARISGVPAPVLLRFVRAAGLASVQVEIVVRPAGTAAVPRRRVRFDSVAARRALDELAARKNDAFTERMDLEGFEAVRASLMTARELVFACGLGVPESNDIKAMVRRLTKAGVRSVRDTHTVIMFSKENVRTVQAFPVREVLIRYADHLEAGKDRAPRVQLRTTAELAAAVRVSAENAVNWGLDLSAPIAGEPIEAILDPYVLGAWLGDGNTGSPAITCWDQPILDEISAAGYELSARKATGHYGIIGVIDNFRALDLLGNKHIPSQYLRASFNQRLALLQGLMDTDGTVMAQGTCELSLCHDRLAADAFELIRSLGVKCTSTPSSASYVDKDGNRKITGTRHRMSFTTSMPVFRLRRKLERLPTATRPTQGLLYITSVTKVESERVRCISVEAADGMYLTHAFIPTHNSPLGRSMLGP